MPARNLPSTAREVALLVLCPEHAATLARFRIPPLMLEAAGVRSVTDAEARETLGLNGHQGADLGGILFPYNHPLAHARAGGRIRLDHPLPDNGRKYMMEPGCRHLFFPPGVADLLRDVNVPVVIVEAEKSALALTALAARASRKLLAIASGGCWGWRRNIGKRSRPDGDSEPQTGPSPDLDFIAWQRREVIICFDSTATSNSKVRRARNALAHELAGRGANVLIAAVPTEPGVNGPDDLVAVSDDDAMLGVLDTARPFAVCALTEAEQTVAALQADKKSDPLPAIEAIAAIEDPGRRTLLIGGLAALRLSGVNRTFVEQQVRNHRAEAEACRRKATDAATLGRLMAMDVEGAALLDEVCAHVRRFVNLSESQARVVALWTAHTHTFAAAEATPYLAITSAEKQSGKTRLLEVLNLLVANPWKTGGVSAAALYRKIDRDSPALLLDESDAAFNGDQEYAEVLRGILNTGHGRGGTHDCCVKEEGNITTKDFSTFCPKAIAGIGKLPNTVADRSIHLRMKRQARGEKVERWRKRDVLPETEPLRERLEAWGCQNIEKLRDARPALPEELSDRQQDGVEPLLAIADLASGKWPEAARRALVSLCCGAQAADDSIGTRLLSDIRQIFKTQNTDRLRSAELATALAEIETSPWGEWKSRKPITPIGVARLLKPFEIGPHNIRVESGVLKGYEVGDFGDAWARYLSPEASPEDMHTPRTTGFQAATPLQAAVDAGLSGFRAATTEENVAGQKREIVNETGACSGIAASKPHAGARVCRPEEEL
jgi:hypothetical protein